MTNVNERWMERQQADDEFEKSVNKVKSFNVVEYMKWLEKFTEKHELFDRDDWEEDKADISEEDYMNVCILDIFYRVIENYANANYISGDTFIRGVKRYYIGYNDKKYLISINTKGLEYSYSWELICPEAETIFDKYIPFEDILNPSTETLSRTKKIKKNVLEIEELFNRLAKNGVPIEVIKKESTRALQKLTNN